MQTVAQVVQHLTPSADPDLLVGPEQFSDAGVYRLTDEIAIVQTVDFFAPVVDDPYTYGQIAAANSLSDVYATGGRPITALNIIAFPIGTLEQKILDEILAGGSERAAEAGTVIVGGHSVRDTELKYGLSVTGIVHPKQYLTNSGAKPGDVLLLTKPLGTGFITTAARADRCPTPVLDAACQSMIQLNRTASQLAVKLGATACTDVTGFGLAGHALEMAEASGVTLRLNLRKLPIISGCEELAITENYSGGYFANEQYVRPSLQYTEPSTEESPLTPFLFDPQTSGGLLIALPEEQADQIRGATIIGSVEEKQKAKLFIE